jgi:hypothetical protein
MKLEETIERKDNLGESAKYFGSVRFKSIAENVVNVPKDETNYTQRIAANE